MGWLWHQLAHFTGQNYGSIDSFWEGERLMMCFRCEHCGKRLGIHESRLTSPSSTANPEGSKGEGG